MATSSIFDLSTYSAPSLADDAAVLPAGDQIDAVCCGFWPYLQLQVGTEKILEAVDASAEGRRPGCDAAALIEAAARRVIFRRRVRAELLELARLIRASKES